MKTVRITYFSDVLCIWAHIGELRVDAIARAFDGRVSFDAKFCSVFGDTARKVAAAWGAKGGYEGFNAHLRHVVEAFPEVTLNPDVWRTVRPASSFSPHLFIKAAQLAEGDGASPAGGSIALTQALRRAFFVDALDIATWDVQAATAREQSLPLAPIEANIRDGRAFAALASDLQDAEAMGIQGSPSFVLNEGRQTLYGNVGFKIIEANIQELLRDPLPENASWC